MNVLGVVLAVVLALEIAVLVWLYLRVPQIISRRPKPRKVNEDKEIEAKTVKTAMPVDPENPPSWKVYAPKEGAPERTCVCHPDRPLRDGQRVLWWPVPKSNGGVNVFCENGIEIETENRSNDD